MVREPPGAPPGARPPRGGPRERCTPAAPSRPPRPPGPPRRGPGRAPAPRGASFARRTGTEPGRPGAAPPRRPRAGTAPLPTNRGRKGTRASSRRTERTACRARSWRPPFQGLERLAPAHAPGLHRVAPPGGHLPVCRLEVAALASPLSEPRGRGGSPSVGVLRYSVLVHGALSRRCEGRAVSAVPPCCFPTLPVRSDRAPVMARPSPALCVGSWRLPGAPAGRWPPPTPPPPGGATPSGPPGRGGPGTYRRGTTGPRSGGPR